MHQLIDAETENLNSLSKCKSSTDQAINANSLVNLRETTERPDLRLDSNRTDRAEEKAAETFDSQLQSRSLPKTGNRSEAKFREYAKRHV